MDRLRVGVVGVGYLGRFHALIYSRLPGVELVGIADTRAEIARQVAAEAGWRPLDLARDNVEEPRRGENYGETYPYEDTTVLYYWRATYWRRVVG